jgi:uncharacterized protein YjbI with pentapeptide repeats
MGKCSYTWREWDSEESEFVGRRCSRETWEGSDEFCIFHDPSPNKDVDLFKEKLEEQLQSEADRYCFIGYFFPKAGCDFENQEFAIDADFWGATFQDASFSKATFQDANFREATFQDADFWGATFQGKANFGEATFQGAASFAGATFHGTADFGEAAFLGTAYFNVTTFQDASFAGATFQDADFSEATFQGKANFGEATFRNARFERVAFQKSTNFSETTFLANSYFLKSTFQNVYCRGATFQDVDFLGVTFHDVDFRGAFFQNAYFRGAFFQNAYFHESTFQERADFSEAVFRENFEFFPNYIKKLDLLDSKFLSRGIITADLTEARFYRAYLQNMAFIDCIWPGEIYEEHYKEGEGISYNQLETIYRDLKQNMENHGDYDTAGRFHYREMEMRRKASAKWKDRIWLNVYRIVGGYGERPLNTATVSGVIIYLFALTYWGLECLRYSRENLTSIQQFVEALYQSLLIFLISGLGSVHPLNSLAIILICSEAIIGAFLIVFFVVIFIRRLTR